MKKAEKKEIGLTDISEFMKGKGYFWSNEAKVYFHMLNKLPTFTADQAKDLYLLRKQEEEKKERITNKQLDQLTFLKAFYSELAYGNYIKGKDFKDITLRVEMDTGVNFEGRSVLENIDQNNKYKRLKGFKRF